MVSAVPDQLIFKVVSSEGLRWREWDTGCAVFNRITGETHFLDLTSSFLLRLLETRSRSSTDLAKQMAADLERVLDTTLQSQVGRTIQNFQSMGLVEPAQ